jgi:hypothetical protein
MDESTNPECPWCHGDLEETTEEELKKLKAFLRVRLQEVNACERRRKQRMPPSARRLGVPQTIQGAAEWIQNVSLSTLERLEDTRRKGEQCVVWQHRGLSNAFVTRLNALRQLRQPLEGNDEGPDMPEAPKGDEYNGHKRRR